LKHESSFTRQIGKIGGLRIRFQSRFENIKALQDPVLKADSASFSATTRALDLTPGS
jgi:hypothetical protein